MVVMKKGIFKYAVPFGTAALFCCILLWFLRAVNSAENVGREGRLEAVKQSVENAVTLCYSIEGAYPSSADYLIENYGLNYDKEKYIVHYDCFAVNIRPSVTVMERGA